MVSIPYASLLGNFLSFDSHGAAQKQTPLRQAFLDRQGESYHQPLRFSVVG